MNAATASPRKGTRPRTVLQAIREASTSTAPPPVTTFSCYKTENVTRRPNGRRIGRRAPWQHNLATDGAAGWTGRRDWQSKALGQGPSFAFATATGAAAAGVTISATTLTNSGASFPATPALQGMIVAVYGLTNNSFVYGVIMTNTGTVLTVDQWYNPASTSGAAGTTPTASGGSSSTGIAYMIIPGSNPASWLALTSDSAGPVNTDTTLASEATTNGYARAVGTYSHTTNTGSYTLAHTFTATGGLTVNKEAVFGACNTTGGGVMPFESAEPTPPAMLSGDTLAQSVVVSI